MSHRHKRNPPEGKGRVRRYGPPERRNDPPAVLKSASQRRKEARNLLRRGVYEALVD